MFDNCEEEIDFEEAQIRCKMMADDPLSLQYELEDYCAYKHDKTRFGRFDYIDEVYEELMWDPDKDMQKAQDSVDTMMVDWWLDGNNFPDMPPEDIIDFFKYSDKTVIMNKKDFEIWNSLPERVTLYRGAATGDEFGRVKLSWTLNPKKAWFFAEDNAHRKGGYPVVYEINVPRALCLAYFSVLKEDEIILDVFEFVRRGFRMHPNVGCIKKEYIDEQKGNDE